MGAGREMNEVHAFDGCHVRAATVDGRIDVEIIGELDGSNSSGVRSVLVGMLARAAHVAVDLSQIRFIDSSGLGALIRVAQAANQSGVRFEVVRPSSTAWRLISMSGVDKLLVAERP